ncbi:MAG: hypothetical protein G01um10147_1135 [Microgenomates group bacterium Gr01-1014_7]|nr:MAG: hypothetical protein G01um10147_1135 [Microgenomates group bacterium Gr01-1014_7]
MREFLQSDPRNYPGFIHTIGRIRNPKYDDENAWTRMQKLLNSRVDSFGEPVNLRTRGMVRDAFMLRRAAFLERLDLDESDSLIDRVLTTPLHLRERRIVCQVLPHLENILPIDGAAPLFQGILTWRPPFEPRNGEVLQQEFVELELPQIEEIEPPEIEVMEPGQIEPTKPEITTPGVKKLSDTIVDIRDYLGKLPF